MLLDTCYSTAGLYCTGQYDRAASTLPRGRIWTVDGGRRTADGGRQTAEFGLTLDLLEQQPATWRLTIHVLEPNNPAHPRRPLFPKTDTMQEQCCNEVGICRWPRYDYLT